MSLGVSSSAAKGRRMINNRMSQFSRRTVRDWEDEIGGKEMNEGRWSQR